MEILFLAHQYLTSKNVLIGLTILIERSQGGQKVIFQSTLVKRSLFKAIKEIKSVWQKEIAYCRNYQNNNKNKRSSIYFKKPNLTSDPRLRIFFHPLILTGTLTGLVVWDVIDRNAIGTFDQAMFWSKSFWCCSLTKEYLLKSLIVLKNNIFWYVNFFVNVKFCPSKFGMSCVVWEVSISFSFLVGD